MSKKPTETPSQPSTQHKPRHRPSHRYFVETLTGSEDSWLTVQEAVQMSKRPAGTIRYWIFAGKLPIYAYAPDHIRQVRLSDLKKLTEILEPHLPFSREPVHGKPDNEKARRQRPPVTKDGQKKLSDLSQTRLSDQSAVDTPVSAIALPAEPVNQASQLTSVLQELVVKQERLLLAFQQHSYETVQGQLAQSTENLWQHLLRQQETIKRNQIELLTQHKFQREALQELLGMMCTMSEQFSEFALTLDQLLKEVRVMLQNQCSHFERVQQSLKELPRTREK